MAYSIPTNLLGFRVQGDLGGCTIYTDRFNQKIVYPIDHPKKPPSAQQVGLRSSFRSAQAAWAALSAGEKAALELACRRLSLRLTGQNLWISCVMRLDAEGYATVARQSGVELPPLP